MTTSNSASLSRVTSANPVINRATQEARFGWKLVTPSLLVVGLLIIYPIIYNLYLSFFEVHLAKENEFVGLSNYLYLLQDTEFYGSLWTTAIFLVATTAGTTLLGLGVAILMNRKFPFRGFVRGLILLPYIAPVISVVFSWQFIFDPVSGIFNYVVVDILNMTDQRFNLIGDPDYALIIVVIFDIWKNFPFAYLMILSRLQSINVNLYEAASLDGASGWQKFRHITMPELRFVVGAIIILRFIWNMNKFEEVYLLASNVKTLPVYTYFIAFTGNIEQGLAASISVIQFLLLMIIILYYVKKVLQW